MDMEEERKLSVKNIPKLLNSIVGWIIKMVTKNTRRYQNRLEKNTVCSVPKVNFRNQLGIQDQCEIDLQL